MHIYESPSAFAIKIAKSFPRAFFSDLHHAFIDGYQSVAKELPRASELQYMLNTLPHLRNTRIFEAVHRVCLEWPELAVQESKLDNGYYYPIIETQGTRLQLKHFNPLEPLNYQTHKAKYRQAEAATNPRSRQLTLAEMYSDTDWNANLLFPGEKHYVILYYYDGNFDKWSLGNLEFILPSCDKTILARASMDEVMLAYDAIPPALHTVDFVLEEDDIIITPRHDEEEVNDINITPKQDEKEDEEKA